MNDVPSLIIVQHKELFVTTCQSIYDMLDNIPNDWNNWNNWNPIMYLSTPEGLRQGFKAGYLAFYLPSYMETIENYDKSNTPYIIVVMKDDKIFTTITPNEVTY